MELKGKLPVVTVCAKDPVQLGQMKDYDSGSGNNFALRREWFDRVGYDVDIPSLEREFGIKGTNLVEWAGKQRQ